RHAQANRRASGLKRALKPYSNRQRNGTVPCPVATSQVLTVPSQEAARRRLPSGLKAIAATSAGSSERVRIGRTSSLLSFPPMSHSLTRRSQLADASVRPSGLHASVQIFFSWA